MKKREISLVGIFLVIFILLGVFPGPCFERSRPEIMDLLADPSKFERGIVSDEVFLNLQKYAVNESSWGKFPLANGTPRWLAQSNSLYNYELIGVPLETATLCAGVILDTEQIGELAKRSTLLMRACGMSRYQADDAFLTLFNCVIKDPDQTHFIDAEGFRVEMIFYDAMSMIFLSVKSRG